MTHCQGHEWPTATHNLEKTTRVLFEETSKLECCKSAKGNSNPCLPVCEVAKPQRYAEDGFTKFGEEKEEVQRWLPGTAPTGSNFLLYLAMPTTLLYVL